MQLNLITFSSVLAKQETNAIKEAHKELIQALEAYFTVNIYLQQQIEELPKVGLNVAFIATGGTESLLTKRYDELPHPLILLTDGKANSLAASMEISSWVRDKGDKCKILHGSFQLIINQLKAIATLSMMKCKRIGVIGEPSNWLVASNVDYEKARERWGVEYVDIPLCKAETYYKETNEEESSLIAQTFLNNSQACIEPSLKEICKAAKLYLAIKRIVQEEKLDALTIQCFSLISSLGTTGCLALSLLNDDGIIAGCEGDLQTIFTMLLVKQATGKDTFMANPAHIDIENNEIIFAHCTIGLKQTTNYIIRSHFESLSGVAVQGLLPEGDITIVKIGGKNLDKSCVLEGRIIENQNDSRKCRTQIRIALDSKTSSVSYFLNESIGNHHVILQGHHAELLKTIL